MFVCLGVRISSPPRSLLVAQVKGTVLLMPNGSDLVTKAPAQPLASEKKVEDAEVVALLATSIKTNKKKKDKVAAAPPA